MNRFPALLPRRVVSSCSTCTTSKGHIMRSTAAMKQFAFRGYRSHNRGQHNITNHAVTHASTSSGPKVRQPHAVIQAGFHWDEEPGRVCAHNRLGQMTLPPNRGYLPAASAPVVPAGPCVCCTWTGPALHLQVRACWSPLQA
jgi:hypothetical protein